MMSQNYTLRAVHRQLPRLSVPLHFWHLYPSFFNSVKFFPHYSHYIIHIIRFHITIALICHINFVNLSFYFLFQDDVTVFKSIEAKHILLVTFKIVFSAIVPFF